MSKVQIVDDIEYRYKEVDIEFPLYTKILRELSFYCSICVYCKWIDSTHVVEIPENLDCNNRDEIYIDSRPISRNDISKKNSISKEEWDEALKNVLLKMGISLI